MGLRFRSTELSNPRSWVSLVVIILGLLTGFAHGQQPTETPSIATEKAAPAPLPLVELFSESEATAGSLRDIRGDLSSDRSTETVAQQLPKISRQIDARLRESRKIVAQTPSIEMLRGLEGEWRRLRRELFGLNKDLGGRVYELDRYIAQLDDLAKTWDQTFAAAKESTAPPEVLGRIENITSDIRQAREAVEKQRSRALTMQTRVGVQDSRVANVLTSIDQARESALDRLFLPDNAPIWTPSMRSPSAQDLQRESLSSFSRQWDALRTYADTQAMRFVLGIAGFISIAAVLSWARRRVRRFSLEKAGFSMTSSVLEMPIAAALILSLLAGRWIFPQAPRVLWAVLGGLVLIPSVLIVKRLSRS